MITDQEQVGAAVDQTPDNPSPVTGEQQVQQAGLSEDDKTAIVQLIQSYRQGWSPDRLLRFPGWLKNIQFFKGTQILGWDPAQNVYFDALGWYRQNGSSDTDDIGLEKYINNITEMFGTAYIAALSRGIPPTVVKPEDAANLTDTTTAKAAQQAISVIERMNDAPSMVRYENWCLYIFGCYFKHTRLVIDGEWAGYEEMPDVEEVEINLPDRLHCKACDKDVTADDNLTNCPSCQEPYGPEDFYEGGPDIQMRAKIKRIPKGMVKWTVYGADMVDTDPKAKTLRETPLLALDMEVDVGWLRATFSQEIDKITEGALSATSTNASYERLVRNLIISKSGAYTSDTFQQQPTYSQIWVQPFAYYRLQDNDLKNPNSLLCRLLKDYELGMKVMMCGDNVLAIEPAQLTKEWSHCPLHDGLGMYPQPSPADKVVPFNEAFNNISFIVDDYMERASAGLTVMDGRRLDIEAVNGKRLLPGQVNNVPSKPGNDNTPLDQLMHTFEFFLEPRVFDYLQQKMMYCQNIAGITPEMMGVGTHPGVETAGGQKQQLNQGEEKLGVAWQKLKAEHAQASDNALYCLQHNRDKVGDLWDVIQENGSEFRNNYVQMSELEGRVRVMPEIDEGLPRSPEQIRQWAESMSEDVKDNPVKQAFWDLPSNQDWYFSTIGVDGPKSPDAAMRACVLQDIRQLLEEPAVPIMQAVPDPNTGQPQVGQDGQPITQQTGSRLPVEPDKRFYDFPVLKATVKEFMQSNRDLRKDNPQGWQWIEQYYDMAEQMETQVNSEDAQRKATVMQAGAPKPQPNPLAQTAQQEAVKDGAAAAQALLKIGEGPLLEKGTGGSNVTALKELLDTALKSLSGGK